MEALDFEAQISTNRRGVTFVLAGKNGAVECMIVRAALEACFWLPTDADDAKMMKTFHDGVHRIHAVAHRKLLARPSTRLELTTADFSRGLSESPIWITLVACVAGAAVEVVRGADD